MTMPIEQKDPACLEGQEHPHPTSLRRQAEPSSASSAELLSGKLLHLSEPQKWKK